MNQIGYLKNSIHHHVLITFVDVPNSTHSFSVALWQTCIDFLQYNLYGYVEYKIIINVFYF